MISTPNRFLIFLFFCICLICSKAADAQAIGDYRSNTTAVTWESGTGWQRYNGTAWVTATTAPSATTFTNNTISVLSGHTLTVTTTPVNQSSVSVSLFNTSGTGSGNTINVAGTIDFTGSGNNCATTITLPSNNTLYVTGAISLSSSGNGGTFVNLVINGTLDLTNKQFTWGTSGGGGTNSLTINGTLITANANGVYNTATAAIPTPIAKTSATLTTTATYILNGGTQNTAGLPSTVNILEISSTGTVTLSAATTVSTALNLTAGTLNNTTNNITLSTGATITRSGGSLSAAPTFGTTVNVVYAQHTAAITTGIELPSINTVLNNLTINNSNGVNLNAARTVNGTLTLSNGLFDLGNNNLTSVKTTAPIISGGSATSYIKTSGTGTVKALVANGATVVFPVGNSSYNALSIKNNTGTADDFAVRVYDVMNTNGTSSGTAVSTARVNRTWDIAKTIPSANAGAGIDLVFNWNAADVASTMATTELFHYISGWQKQTGTKSVTTTSLSYTGYKGSFSPFAIADGALATLPVSFLSFAAQKKEQAVVLNWTTANEQNAADFFIQHSANGSNWNTIGNVDAKGNSNIITAYSFKHESPFAGKNYYRIYQVDADGKGYYTPVVQLNNSQAVTVKILTNPVSNGLLSLQIPGNATVQLFTSEGRMLVEKKCSEGVSTINVSSYPKGVYQVRIENKTLSFIIQ